MEEEIIGEGVELKAKFFFLREKGGGQKRENGRGKKFQFPLSMKLKLEARALALSRGKHSNIEKRMQEKSYKKIPTIFPYLLRRKLYCPGSSMTRDAGIAYAVVRPMRGSC